MITVAAASTITALKIRNLAMLDAGTTSSQSLLIEASLRRQDQSLVAMAAVKAHEPGMAHHLERHETVRAALENGHPLRST